MAFQDTIALILKWEGIYDNDPDDPGEETVFGITRHFEPDWIGWEIVDAMFAPTPHKDRQTQTAKDWATENLPANPALMNAVSMYYHAVFQTLDLDDCPSDALDSCIMGGWVNQGPRVEKWTQEVINELGGCVEVDGHLGPGTMKELRKILQNPLGEKALLQGLMLKRVKAYAKSKPKYIAGLLNRLFAGA